MNRNGVQETIPDTTVVGKWAGVGAGRAAANCSVSLLSHFQICQLNPARLLRLREENVYRKALFPPSERCQQPHSSRQNHSHGHPSVPCTRLYVQGVYKSAVCNLARNCKVFIDISHRSLFLNFDRLQRKSIVNLLSLVSHECSKSKQPHHTN